MSVATIFQHLLDQLRHNTQLEKLAPVYVVQGEEGYFADQLVEAFQELLPEDDRAFDAHMFYATQCDPQMVMDVCRRYPMMATRQVVILREAQGARADVMDKYAPYLEQPSPSTVLLIAARGDKAKGAKFASALRKSKEVALVDAKKIPEYKMGEYIKSYINSRGLNVQPKALEMLQEFVGVDLSRMYNELDKLTGILGQGATVTVEAVEKNIGVSREYTSFELADALANRDAARAGRITRYFRSNPKAVPMVMLTGVLFNFFSDLLVTYFVKDKSERGLMEALNLKTPYALRRFNVARTNYNAFQVIEIIRSIRKFDAEVKGIGSRRSEFDLLDELVFRILTAPGTLFPKY